MDLNELKMLYKLLYEYLNSYLLYNQNEPELKEQVFELLRNILKHIEPHEHRIRLILHDENKNEE